jgi:Na+/melibiose symporter-like transporter
VNVLQSVDAKTVFVVTNPVESFAPYDKILNNISRSFQFSYGVIIFEKTFLAISVSLIFMILIPLCALITISIIWKNKDKKEPYRIVIVSVLISIVVLFAVPVSLKLSAIIEEKALSENLNSLVSSINENRENAVKLENELKGLRRAATTINNNISHAKVICDSAVKDMINYFIIFIIIYMLIPLLAVFGLYKITRFSIKMIMTK